MTAVSQNWPGKPRFTCEAAQEILSTEGSVDAALTALDVLIAAVPLGEDSTQQMLLDIKQYLRLNSTTLILPAE